MPRGVKEEEDGAGGAEMGRAARRMSAWRVYDAMCFGILCNTHKSYPENMYLLVGPSNHVARKPPISFFDHFLGGTRTCEAFSCSVVAVQRIPPATTSHPTFGRRIAVCKSFVD